MVANFEAGGAAVNQLSKAAGAGFRVVPLDLDIPTNDFTARPALDEEAFMIAFTAGWHVVGNDCDLLAVGDEVHDQLREDGGSLRPSAR